MGLKVVAIDGGPAKEALCTKLGADKVIDFTQEKVRGEASISSND
jgi:D-arabinose 1-dehydrogenase-like Zn-dependent alcohol dehydrogenase